MKFIGWVMSAGLAAAAGGAVAQPLPSYQIRVSPYSTVSDVGGPYAAMPPKAPPPRYAPEGAYAPEVIPPHEVYAVLRENGYSALGVPRQRGLVYTIAAINLDGDDGRLVIDARNGRILRFMPAYRMGNLIEEETVVSYGAPRPLPPMTDYRRPPRPPLPVPHLASRSPSGQLPKQPHQVGDPKAELKAGVVKPAAPPQAVASQSRPAETAAAPSVAAPVEAKPSPTIQPTQPMPPAQGLE